MLVIVVVVDAINSLQLDGPVRRVLTAVRARQLCGAGTKMATPSATRVVFTSSFTTYVSQSFSYIGHKVVYFLFLLRTIRNRNGTGITLMEQIRDHGKISNWINSSYCDFC